MVTLRILRHGESPSFPAQYPPFLLHGMLSRSPKAVAMNKLRLNVSGVNFMTEMSCVQSGLGFPLGYPPPIEGLRSKVMVKPTNIEIAPPKHKNALEMHFRSCR